MLSPPPSWTCLGCLIFCTASENGLMEQWGSWSGGNRGKHETRFLQVLGFGSVCLFCISDVNLFSKYPLGQYFEIIPHLLKNATKIQRTHIFFHPDLPSFNIHFLHIRINAGCLLMPFNPVILQGDIHRLLASWNSLAKEMPWLTKCGSPSKLWPLFRKHFNPVH